MTPKWAVASLLDVGTLKPPADVLRRLFDAEAATAWAALDSDDQRRLVLKAALVGGAFYGRFGEFYDGPARSGPGRTEQKERAKAAAKALRAAAAALTQAPLHFRYVAAADGVRVEALRSAAKSIDEHQSAYPFSSNAATARGYIAQVAAEVKAITGCDHDKLVVAVVNAIDPGIACTDNKLKDRRRPARQKRSGSVPQSTHRRPA